MNTLWNALDKVDLVNFPALLVLEMIGLLLLIFRRRWLVLRGEVFWGLVGLWFWLFGWRLLLVEPSTRYYSMVLLPMLPLAVVPFCLDWTIIPYSPRVIRWSRIGLSLGVLVVIGLCIGKSFRPDKSNATITEAATILRQQCDSFPAGRKTVFLDNTTRINQVFLAAGIRLDSIWTPTYKEEETLNFRRADHLDYIAKWTEIKEYEGVIIFYRTNDFEAVDETVKQFSQQCSLRITKVFHLTDRRYRLYFLEK